MAQNICATPSKIKVPPHVKRPTQIPLNRRGVVLLEMIPKPFSFAENNVCSASSMFIFYFFIVNGKQGLSRGTGSVLSSRFFQI